MRKRAPVVLGITVGLMAVSAPAGAQVGSANVPLPNVLLLLDTSGSFEHMIDGSNPEDTTAGPYNTNSWGNNNASTHQYANCETAANPATGGPYAALPNRWGIAVQALTGTILNQNNQPFYSCTTMDRIAGQPPLTPTGTVPQIMATSVAPSDGLDLQYGLRDEAGKYFFPYDSGYYLPFHRPVALTSAGECVYSPNVLPGAIVGGVGLSGGFPASGDCPNESGACWATDYPADAIGQFLYDRYPGASGQTGTAITSTQLYTNPNLGYSSNTQSCVFNQATDGIMDQASTLIRFGLMTFDNDPSPAIGVQGTPIAPMQYSTLSNAPGAVAQGTLPPPSSTVFGGPESPFTGMWSYDSYWNSASAAVAPAVPFPYYSPLVGWPAGCGTKSWFELGARNPAAPPWEGRLIGFPSADADVIATGQLNQQIQTTINAMRPYGATPTAGLMADAEYYFWGDPTGPGAKNPKPDPYVQGGCRAQYIILLTDGQPNQDLRPSCQSPATTTQGTTSGGLCPYQLPEETAFLLATGTGDPQTGLSAAATNKVYTYVVGFAVSGNVNGTDTGTANCAALAASGALKAQCGTGAPYSPTDTSATTTITGPVTPSSDASVALTESPCCSLQRIAVAGGTQHAYFADTPGDLNAALAAVLGDITGQLGSRTIPVASPTISYAAGSGPVTATFLSTFQAATCPVALTAAGTCPTTWQAAHTATSTSTATTVAWSGDVQRQQYTCPSAGGSATPSSGPLTGDDFGADLIGQTMRNFLIFNGWDSLSSTSTNSLTLRPYLNASHIITSSNSSAAPLADGFETFGTYGQTGQEFSNFSGPTGGSVSSLYGAFQPSLATALGVTGTSCQDPASGQYLDTPSCGSLALSFAMAQSSFPYGSTAADTNVGNAYASPTGPFPATNRAASPLGAILDSTPAIVAAPSAQVRDDSYLAFSTALSNIGGGQPPRDTMLYVATIDGLLHAFDTSVGIPNGGTTLPTSEVEAWSFIPPAVLPHLIQNYPGASQVLLDGAPIVKDVVFSRCETPGTICGQPPSTQWVSGWHTMLVAGYGLGGRGYYALDVTDPRPPSGATNLGAGAFATANYLTSVQPGASGATLTGAPGGPHFQWQITSLNLTGSSATPIAPGFTPPELFGKISATPAIATVYADPTVPTPGNPTYPQEIGIAILPGGHDGLPTPNLVCPRELSSSSLGYLSNYTTRSPLYTTVGQAALALPSASPYNVSDAQFPPRTAVRAWGAPMKSPLTACNNSVSGRSVMIVSVATGQILQIFTRAPPKTFAANPSTWDVPSDGNGHALVGNLSIAAGQNPYLNFTPLDSPMTGKPVVYPSGVGVVAQAAYIGDADGTMWRFDLSDPNPRNWTGAIFSDAYSPLADTSGGEPYVGGAGSPTDWPALDSEAISVEPQIALDASANVTMNYATGDQTTFNTCYQATGTSGGNHNSSPACTGSLQPAVNFVYSVKELRNTTGSNIPPYRASVNWYQEWTTGERVTGPMAIFNGALYFATYSPEGSGGTVGCGQGGPNLYGWNFSKAAASCVSTHYNGAAVTDAPGDSGLPVGCGGDGSIDPNFAPTYGVLNFSQIQGGTNSNVTANTVIPGVSIASTPSCATTSSAAGTDPIGGFHTTITNPSPPTYSLMANIGKGKKSTAQNLVSQPLVAPASPTLVDSWVELAE